MTRNFIAIGSVLKVSDDIVNSKGSEHKENLLSEITGDPDVIVTFIVVHCNDAML